MNSRIFYRGPSQLDGKPILGIITGLEIPSRNAKTGNMLQTYILREDLPPPEAVRLGEDRSICGSCVMRGDGNGLGRSCYVQTKWAPLGLWKSLQPIANDWYNGTLTDAFRHTLKGRFLRLGSYGDPCAIPLYVWEWLLYMTGSGHTGYTHQWRDPQFHAFKKICMASVDTLEELRDAHISGWRTFRARTTTQPLTRGEIVCPASAEAGHKTTCQECRLCDGAARGHQVKSIAIYLHGMAAGKRGKTVLPFGVEEDVEDESRDHT